MLRFLFLLIVLAALAGGAWFWEQQNFAAPGSAQNYTVVTVAPGDHVATIAQHLADAGVVDNADLFRVGLRIRGHQTELKAGEYGFPAHASMADVMDVLVAGKSIEHKITAAEGLTSQMIANIVESDTVLVGSAGPVPPEGTLLPETYLFTRGMTRAQMLAKMHAAQVKFLDAQWAGRQPNLPVRTREEALVLASVVEKETGLPEERRHIASVFENRLRLGMKLQSDPTIIYGITKGYPLGRGIRQSELVGVTPYNTYVIAGLPPRPICNPGKDAIAAVLNPETTNDLYFVATGHGGHVFTSTLAAHEQNVAKLRQVERAH
ncbi:MAG TPA: endolytic transglycosylase MltG [Rhizomicrobium sp.]